MVYLLDLEGNSFRMPLLWRCVVVMALPPSFPFTCTTFLYVNSTLSRVSWDRN